MQRNKTESKERERESGRVWAIDSPIKPKTSALNNHKEKQRRQKSAHTNIHTHTSRKTVETTIAAVNQKPWHYFCKWKPSIAPTIGQCYVHRQGGCFNNQAIPMLIHTRTRALAFTHKARTRTSFRKTPLIL